MRLGTIDYKISMFTQCRKCRKFANGKIWSAEGYFPVQEGMYTTPKNIYNICESCAKTENEAKEIISIFLEKDTVSFLKKYGPKKESNV